MHKLVLILAVAGFAFPVPATSPAVAGPVTAAQMTEIGRIPHPRLLLPPDGDRKLRANAQTPLGKILMEEIRSQADQLLTAPVEPRKVDYGQRTLWYNRGVFNRINTLATAYRITGDIRYAQRGKTELLAAARLPEWYLRFFLDCAEMTFAAAIGYDWLYEHLTPAERDLVAEAIVKNGLKASFTPGQFWVSGTNNWCQVCHAAMTAAAIAVADREPELAARTINRALENLPRVMKISYAPTGAYPEGPGYWNYGTTYNCLMIAALENVFGHDFGLAEQPGFNRTGEYIAAMNTNTGRFFSYSDSGTISDLGFATVWLAWKFRKPEWIPQSLPALYRRRSTQKNRQNRWIHPLMMLYADIYRGPATAIQASDPYLSAGDSRTHIAVLRSGFSRSDTYLGIKGGSPTASHGHMDAGSFVLESGGVPWLLDLGGGNYGNMEKNGIKTLFKFTQDSDRWQVFRIGGASHNIIRIDGGEQQIKGFARLSSDAGNRVTANLDSLYAGQAKTVRRTFTLQPDGSVEVRDELTGLRPGAEVAAQFCTGAGVTAGPGNSVILSQDGRELTVTADSATPGTWRITPVEKLLRQWDVKDKNRTMVSYLTKAAPDGRAVIITQFKLLK